MTVPLTGGCTGTFILTESPAQSFPATAEPTVTSLQITASLSCSTDPGYSRASVTMAGGEPAESCTNGTPGLHTGPTASTYCVISAPPVGTYSATGTVTWGTAEAAWSFSEDVLPGTGVPAVQAVIGNQHMHTDLAPCHMDSTITESPGQQTALNPLAPVSTVTATSTMTCDYFISVDDYVDVTLVGPTGSHLCTNSTPDVQNENTLFVASCSLPAGPGPFVAAFHYHSIAISGCCGSFVDTYHALETTVL